MHPVAHPLRPVAHPLRAMGSQWVRNGSATPPQRGLLGALRATPPPTPPPPRGALRVALRAQSLASRRRRAQALRLRSLAHARQQQHVQVTEVKEGRWRWRSSQQLHDVCQQAGTGRRGRCGLCAVQVMMTSGRTTGHRIAQSWRCRRAAVGPICAGSAAHGPRLSLDVLTRVSQALLMGLASWGYGTPLGKNQVAERFGALMKLLEASMAAPTNAGPAAPAAAAPAAAPAPHFQFGSGSHKDVRAAAALLTRACGRMAS